ncbi:MAG: hypothetical protein WEB00_14385 [Dehalococcoidia bacterium]
MKYAGSLIGIVVLTGLALFAGGVLQPTGSAGGVPQPTQSAGGQPGLPTAPDGICLKTSADEALIQSLFQRAGTDQQGIRSDPRAKTSMEPWLTREEAGAVLAFEARFPDVPPGWSSETTIDGYSPRTPLTGVCRIETVIENPAVTTTRIFPAHPLKLNDGRTVISPEEVYVTTQSAKVFVGRASDPKVGPGVGEPVLVNGLPGRMATRAEDQRVGIGWTDDNVGFDVDCILLTPDECMAIAESVH